MIRGPDGIRQHVLFVPRKLTVAQNVRILDEVETWLSLNMTPNDYHYNRYSVTSSVFVHDLDNVFAIKLRWSDIVVFN